MLGDARSAFELSDVLARRLFPSPEIDTRLLENIMFEESDEMWDFPMSAADPGTLRGAMAARFDVAKDVRS